MEMTAMLVLEFDDSVDRVCRMMFDEKFGKLSWVRVDGLASVWTIEFEERHIDETRLAAVETTLGIALAGARIDPASVRAAVQIGPKGPQTVRPAPQQQRRA